jgi:hypothetical protein
MGSYDNIVLPVSGQPISSGQFGVPVKAAINDIDTRLGGLEATPWSSYTPSFTATSGTPAMGTGGGLFGRYKQFGKIVHLNIYGLFGTAAVVFGTGSWFWTLPVAASSINNMKKIGSAYLNDTSAGGGGHYAGIAGIFPLLSVNSLTAFAGNAQVGAVAPFPWAINDNFALNITYESA